MNKTDPTSNKNIWKLIIMHFTNITKNNDDMFKMENKLL